MGMFHSVLVHLEAVVLISALLLLLHHVHHLSDGALPILRAHLLGDEQADLLDKRVFSQQFGFSL